MPKTQKILVIKLGALGDFVLTTGMMQAIRERYPDAHITLMTNQSFIKLAKQSGYFDDYIVDNRTHKIRDYFRIAHAISGSKFDLIFDLQIVDRTKRLYYFFARFFSKGEFSWANWSARGFDSVHILRKPFFIWGKEERGVIAIKGPFPSLKFCHGENKNFSVLPKEYVLLIPGCSPDHPYKRWPASFYAQLAQRLSQQKIKTVVLGTDAERKEIEEICANNSDAINFCNQSSLMDIPDLAKRALAIVGNDTGPTHMASLVEKPVIALFCKKTERSALKYPNVHNLIKENIADISVDDVFHLLKDIIN